MTIAFMKHEWYDQPGIPIIYMLLYIDLDVMQLISEHVTFIFIFSYNKLFLTQNSSTV